MDLMHYKKREAKGREIDKRLFILTIIIIILGIALFKKPTITGRVAQGEETIYSESLNIEKNESGTYEWQIKNPGSIKSLKATGSVSANGTARVYIEKEGNRYLLFDSTKQLFDINILVLPEYKKILQEDEVLVQITLLNLRGFGSGDVNVNYAIKDPRGNLIAAEEEIVFVETQAKFIRRLLVPAEIKPGTYVASVEASTNGTIVGTGSDTFEVNSKYAYKYPPELKYYAIGLAAIVALSILFVLAIYALRGLKKKKQIAELKEKAPLERMEKLQKELKALEEARKASFISEESYQKEKKRIEEILETLKK